MRVIVSPTTPVAKPATIIEPFSFTANWSRVTDAANYFLDIATDVSFTSFVPGKKNIEVDAADTTYFIDAFCNTTYYYRVRYSSDACKTISANSNTITVTTDSCPVSPECTYTSTCSGSITDTRDNKTYKTVQIGTQCWMAQNLNVGIAIPGEVSQTPGIIEKYCYGYDRNNNDSSNCNTYGGLYLWDHMMGYDTSRINAPGPRGICPIGWHLPTDNEWTCLEKTLSGSATAGGKLKKDTVLWTTPNTGATNSSGFTALPGGYRTFIGSFGGQGNSGFWWTATEIPDQNIDKTIAWHRDLFYNSVGVGHYPSIPMNSKALSGFSVRCVKD